MPDFVAALITAAAFCAGLILLNVLTRWAIQAQIAPADLAENGLLQYGLALALAGCTWRRALATPPVPGGRVRPRVAG
ncbi:MULTISPECIES: hypothetical protein [Methylobacterium]|jgi:hypothetical protein|uniref:Uncharacterized protein n=1 Tax=Methylobacterium bullatum TaxID=570505 RepID=A0A679JIS5_9HYPH|nr:MULTISPECIES: hypothetical protein [unclassified Methylobacterium]KQO46128.1 hypothetical protein ASF08_06850 [Methylobacterium sp. Leaf85]KQP40535.1 hypothetical protein ASF34_12175 [Methylobacterium sp. Leaf106]TXN31666.1 hypothetical protein FV220_05750 [Methylobacterium sp. WL19]CAA2139662.1 hypothetical protein MBLL_01731 [Methylobacterium bullatum]